MFAETELLSVAIARQDGVSARPGLRMTASTCLRLDGQFARASA